MKKYYIIILIAIITYLIPTTAKASNVDALTDKSDFVNQNEPIKLASSTTSQEEIISSQTDALGISTFLSDSEKYTQDTFGDIDISELFTQSLSGNIDNNAIMEIVFALLGDNVKTALTTIASVMVVVIIHSILKAISENLGNENVSKIAYYIEYILIITLVLTNFSSIITEMKQAVQNLTGFANTLIPLMITLMITTGNIVSSGMLQPILLLLITFISNFLTNILIPIALVSTALGIISKISDQAQVGKLSKFLDSSMVWVLGTVLTLFVSVTSLEGGLTSSIDGVTAKAAKTAISSVVPVIGSILGDAVNTIMGCSNIIKNAVGVVGIVVILAICIRPIIQLAVLTITYYLGAALCEPIADEKIVGILEQMGGTFKIFLAVMFALTAMLIIGIAIVMKISNSGLMYG